MTITEAMQIFETITPEQLQSVGEIAVMVSPICFVIFWAIIEVITRMINGITKYIDNRKESKQCQSIN